MATLATPEQCAREILAISVWHFGLLAGDIVHSKNFLTLWSQRGYRLAEFNVGLHYAVDSGWLELLPGANSYRLTKSGFTDA